MTHIALPVVASIPALSAIQRLALISAAALLMLAGMQTSGCQPGDASDMPPPSHIDTPYIPDIPPPTEFHIG